jgi:flagellar motor switch protein FliM
MADVLSQDEIDQLLMSVTSGEIAPADETARLETVDKAIRSNDSKGAKKPAKDMGRELSGESEEFSLAPDLDEKSRLKP